MLSLPKGTVTERLALTLLHLDSPGGNLLQESV